MKAMISRCSGHDEIQPHPNAVQRESGMWEIELNSLDELLDIVALTREEREQRQDKHDGVLIYMGQSGYAILMVDDYIG